MTARDSGRGEMLRSFDFSAAMSELCRDIARRLPAFSHIGMDQVAVAFAQTRRRVSYGLQAKLTPMRFEDGALTMQRNGRTWTVQRLSHHNREILYILTFYLPRFLNHTFREKMVTVFHELYHISPQFNGDIRRLDGHYYVHSHSQKEYDRRMARFVDTYLETNPPTDVYSFLRLKFSTLQSRYGQVVGLQIPVPKLIPVSESSGARRQSA